MEFVLFILLAALALGLGFVALIKQKTYLDPSGGTVTAVEVPFIGKMQTNYPALLFVFVGIAFGYMAFDYKVKINTAKETWTARKTFTIDGQLRSKKNVADWSNTEITVVPSSMLNQQVDSSGHYRIDLQIPKRDSFERWAQSINFQEGELSGRISPGAANDTSTTNKRSETYLNADVDMKLVQ